MKKLATLGIVLTLAGCSSNPPDWIMGSDSNCSQIGCGKDLEFYPMAPGAASANARAHGFEWGQTSSAFPPGSPEHQRLLREEQAAGNTPWHWNNNR